MNNKRSKIALIGGGNVGGTLARIISARNVGNIILIDRTAGTAKGKAIDIGQAAAVRGISANVHGTNDYAEMDGADVVVITAGVARKPGMSRDDLLKVNVDIACEIAHAVAKYAPDAFVIVVTNPLDTITQLIQQHGGFQQHMVVGMAGVLDAARFRYFLAQKLEVSVEDVQTMVLGGHGNNMVPLLSCTSIGGIPLMQFITCRNVSKESIYELVERTRNGGGEIVDLLQTCSAYYAPAASAAQMLESYLFNQKRIMPCSVYIDGQYGIRGVYVGVPVVIGCYGVEQIIELQLTDEESEMLIRSVNDVNVTMQRATNMI